MLKIMLSVMAVTLPLFAGAAVSNNPSMLHPPAGAVNPSQERMQNQMRTEQQQQQMKLHNDQQSAFRAQQQQIQQQQNQARQRVNQAQP